VLLTAFRLVGAAITFWVKGLTKALQLGTKLVQVGRLLAEGEFSKAIAAVRGQESSTSTPATNVLRAANSSNSRVQGQMVVRFENAPPGTRVDPGTTNQPGLDFDPDVGYRAFALGMP
jgi:hypothetical protein